MEYKKGQKFSKLTLVGFHHTEVAKQAVSIYEFKCDCGNTKLSKIGNVKSGNVKSCGCILRVKKPVIFNDEEYSRKEFAKKIGITENYASILLRKGLTPEQIAKRKEVKKPYNFKQRKIELFGRNNVHEIALEMGETRQNIYLKYDKGYKINNNKGKLVWVKSTK